MNGTEALAKIREAYPEYNRFGDRDLAKALIEKYPEHADTFKDIANPPTAIQTGYRAVKGMMTKPFEWAGALDVASGIKTPEQAKSLAETYGGLTTGMALTAPLTAGFGSLGSALGPAKSLLAPAAGRVVGSAAGGALQEYVEGRDPVTGAVLGGLGGTAGETLGYAAPRMPSWLSSLWQSTPMGKRGAEAAKATVAAERAAAKEAARETEKAAGQMVKETRASQEAARIGQQAKLPGLDVQTSTELYQLASGGQGRQILNQRFGQTVAELDEALKANRITGIRVPQLGDKALTLREAVDELQMIGKGIGRAGPGERSVTQNLASLDYGKARTALIQRLEQLQPGSGARLDRALTESSRGRAYLKLLEKSMDKNGKLDPDKLAVNVNRAAGKLADKFGSDWPRMMNVLTGGRPLPVRVTPPVGPGAAAWMPEVGKVVPPRALSPAGQVAVDVMASQPGPREAVSGGGLWLMERIPLLGRHGWHSDLVYDAVSED